MSTNKKNIERKNTIAGGIFFSSSLFHNFFPQPDAAADHENRDFSNPMFGLRPGMAPSSGSESAAEAAVLAPSVVTHQTPPAPLRHRELNPAAIDTGKDTQCLVAEDDSEC